MIFGATISDMKMMIMIVKMTLIIDKAMKVTFSIAEVIKTMTDGYLILYSYPEKFILLQCRGEHTVNSFRLRELLKQMSRKQIMHRGRHCFNVLIDDYFTDHRY